jgi:hypothetical protein
VLDGRFGRRPDELHDWHHARGTGAMHGRSRRDEDTAIM